MAVRWIKPLYGITGRPVLNATRAARQRLLEIGAELAGTDDCVAIYVPEKARGFGDDAYRGRIAGAMWLLPMPAGRTIDDHGFRDIDGTLRWPIGWPVDVARTRKLAPDAAPLLRPLVIELAGAAVWRALSASFQGGAPARLDGALAPLASRLDAIFAGG